MLRRRNAAGRRASACLLLAAICGAAPAARAADDGAELAARGEAALREARYADAIADLSAAARIRSGDAGLHLLLGFAQLRAARYQDAVASLERALALGTTDGRALGLLGQAQWGTGRFDDAERTLRRALETDDAASYPARLLLGRLLQLTGRPAEAEKVYREALAQRDIEPRLWLDLCRCLLELDRIAEATVHCRRAVELAPASPPARLALASALARGGDAEGARRERGEFARLDAERLAAQQAELVGQARLDHGWNLLREGRAADAAGYFRSLPESPSSLVGVAMALSSQALHAEAAAALERAIELAPDWPNLPPLLAAERRALAGAP